MSCTNFPNNLICDRNRTLMRSGHIRPNERRVWGDVHYDVLIEQVLQAKRPISYWKVTVD